MSTLNTVNITNGTDSITVEGAVKGSAKAWVNFNGTGTVAIRASYNVSSITDNGTGDFTVNFATALVDANYATVASAGRGTPGSALVSPSYSTAPAAGSHRIGTYSVAGTLQDYDYIFVAIFR